MKIKIILMAISLVALLSACTLTDNGVLVVRTADPDVNLAFQLPQPEVIPAEEVGEVEPDPTPEPPCTLVKGNISRSREKIYHVPGGANYNQVKIDEAAGEMFFCSEEEAQAAGWRKAQR